MRLLVVCLGNICRSPVAEGVLRARIEASSLRGLIELDSAGTADYRECDWLLCADRANLRDVRARAPKDATAQSALLLDWCGAVADGEIPDPYTGGPAQFEHVFQLLDRAADGAIARLRRELQLR